MINRGIYCIGTAFVDKNEPAPGGNGRLPWPSSWPLRVVRRCIQNDPHDVAVFLSHTGFSKVPKGVEPGAASSCPPKA